MKHGPVRPVTVHLLRHGEVHNPERIIYGRLPGYRLSDRGRAMAEQVAGVLAAVPAGREKVGLVTASPLLRAQQTAEPTAAALGLAVATDECLVEGDSVFEGRRVDRAALRDPAIRRALLRPFRPGWGEPYTAIAARMWSAIGRGAARADAADCSALLVSHQLPVWTARRWGERRRLWHDPRSRQCRLASLTTLTFDLSRLTAPADAVAASALRDALVGIDYSEPARALLAGADDVMEPPPPGTAAGLEVRG